MAKYLKGGSQKQGTRLPCDLPKQNIFKMIPCINVGLVGGENGMKENFGNIFKNIELKFMIQIKLPLTIFDEIRRIDVI